MTVKLHDATQNQINMRDDDDAKYFILGMGVGVLVGTISTFVGNIMSHRWLQKNDEQ